MKTAKELLMLTPTNLENEYPSYSKEWVLEIMIEFAKLHVRGIRELQESKYTAGETGYIRDEEFQEFLNDIK